MNCTMNKAHEMNDKELEMVNGGLVLVADVYSRPEDVAYRFDIGRHAEIVEGILFGKVFTCGCTIVDRKIDMSYDGTGYCAWYKVSCDYYYYDGEWLQEKEFEGGYADYRYEKP